MSICSTPSTLRTRKLAWIKKELEEKAQDMTASTLNQIKRELEEGTRGDCLNFELHITSFGCFIRRKGRADVRNLDSIRV